MRTSLDLLSILLIVTLFQGVFILSVVAIRYSLRSSQHLFLFLMVLCLVWFQAEFLSVRIPFGVGVGLFYGTRYGAWLLLGPLYFFYVKAITGSSLKPLRAILHLVPFIIFWLILPLMTTEMIGNQQVSYGMLSAFYPFVTNMPALQYAYSALFGFQFLHVLSYLLISFRATQEYERSLKTLYSKVDSTVLWLKTMNLLLIGVVIFVSFFLALFFFYHSYNRSLDYLYVVPMAILTYIVSYKLAGVQWTASADPGEKTKKYERTALKPEEAVRIRKQLEEYVSRSKPYLNNELRLQDLADQLNVPSHQLSQVINDQLSLTFFDYINRQRVEEAKRLMEIEPNSTLLEIAFKAGFNNKTSFSNAFKKFTTQTGTDFKKAQKRNQSL